MNEKSRVYNSKRNVVIGLFFTLINTILSFVVRTVFIKTLGNELLSINSLFTEIVSIMSLAELGFGMAIVYKLYRPIKDNDYEKISQYMSLYKKIYMIVAIVFLIIGGIFLPFVHYFVTDIEIPRWYLIVIFSLFVIQTSSSYLFSYKTSLLMADQKNFVVSIITFFVKLFIFVGTIILLYFTRNYIAYIVIQIVQTLVINIIISIYVDKKYPFINYKSKLSEEEKKSTFKDVKDIFIKRLSGIATSSTDNILISTLISTTVVGIYSNYVMIFSVVRLIKTELSRGVSASIGNLSVSETPEKNILVLKRLTFIFFAVAIILCSGLLALSTLFVDLWLGPEFELQRHIVYIVILNLFIEISSEPLWQFLEVSGLFSLDKYIGIIGTVVNLIVSIVLGIYCGIIGIFIGTLCTQVIQLILKSILLFKKKYDKNAIKYLLIWGKIALAFALLVVLQLFVVNLIVFDNLYIEFIVKGLVSLVLGIALACMPFMFTDELKYSFNLVFGFLIRKKRSRNDKSNSSNNDI